MRYSCDESQLRIDANTDSCSYPILSYQALRLSHLGRYDETFAGEDALFHEDGKHICTIMLGNSNTMGCPPVRGDNPRALASRLSSAQVDKHGITILYRLPVRTQRAYFELKYLNIVKKCDAKYSLNMAVKISAKNSLFLNAFYSTL